MSLTEKYTTVNSKPNKLFNKDKVHLAFAPSPLILANYI